MKLDNGIDIINGENVKIALPRIGTRCKLCGEPIEVNNPGSWIKTSVPACPIVYVHRDCAETREYHEGFTSPSGVERPMFGNTKETKEEILMTPEIEAASFYGNYRNDEERAAFLVQFQMWAEYDCTVYREFHPFTVANLHGLKERYRNMEKYIDMTSENCGHHINFSWKGFSIADRNKIWASRYTIFERVENAMERNPEMTKKVFGRNFTYYANNSHGYYHGCWMNLDNDNRLECRLPHYVNPTQIAWCFMMIKEWAKVLRAFCNDEISAEQAAKRIEREFLKNGEGRATYQRKEQNSKI